MDPCVIDYPFWRRFLLVNGLIVPFRRRQSALNYQKIWMDRGAPLKVHTAELARRLQSELGPEWRVDWAMRYGSPRLQDLLRVLSVEKPKEVIVLPLYPHDTKSTRGSALQILRKHSQLLAENLKILGHFYDREEYLESFTQVIKEHWRKQDGDYLLFSFHGLPERHVRELGAACLDTAICCETITARNKHCYRAQCFATARSLASRLDLSRDEWGVAFQSRMGGEAWIGPHTEEVLPELVKEGRRRIFVACPAFVADCLETLEEIGIRARNDVKARGAQLILIPSLNTSPHWVKNLGEALRERRWERITEPCPSIEPRF